MKLDRYHASQVQLFKCLRVMCKTKIIKLFRFAEQLRSAGMSMSNNIAEGSGSNSKKEFIQFLNIARRSTFETANILMLLQRRNLVSKERIDILLNNLDKLCRKITNFQKTLR